jgi:hypothetical protein
MYPNSPISNAQIAAFQNQGFEVAFHLNPNCSVWTPADLQTYFTTQLPAFTSHIMLRHRLLHIEFIVYPERLGSLPKLN